MTAALDLGFSDGEVSRVQALVTALGEEKAAAALGVARATMVRVIARRPVMRQTAFFLRARLTELAKAGSK